jgi:dolichol-phosphate mannosyltransferase
VKQPFRKRLGYGDGNVFPDGAQPHVLTALATYNERDNLAPLVHEIRAVLPAAHVLITDDNSPDGTGKLADELAAVDPHVHVQHRTGKLGLGTAIIAGMRYAMDNGYDHVISMDADYSHHPRYLCALVVGMDRHDVMIGSRYIRGGGTVNWPLFRRLVSGGVNAVSRILLRLPARDTSGGFRCYRTAMLRKTRLDNLLSTGYSFQEEMLYRCRRAGARIGETPIIFEDRRAGASKADLREAVSSMAVILRVGVPAFLGLDG